jgi:hypothetical protein
LTALRRISQMKHKTPVKPAAPDAPVSAPVVHRRRPEARVFRVSEFAVVARMSRSAVYKGMRNGQIPFIVIAGQIRIPHEAVENLVDAAMAGHEARKSA